MKASLKAFGQVRLDLKPIATNQAEVIIFFVCTVMYFAQFMGFMPIQGIRSGYPFKFEFRWKAFRVMITMIYCALGGFMATTYLMHIVRIGINAKNIVPFVFFSCNLSSGLLFLFLAQKWKRLGMVWYEREKVFLNLPYKKCGWRLSTKIRITAAVILFLATVEHSMAVLNAVYTFNINVSICKLDIDDKWKYFYESGYPQIFNVVPYHFIFTILIEFAITLLTFGWNYIDTFIMVTSIGLATRFRQINQRLKELKNEPLDESLWAEIRHHYVLLCELVEAVDKNVAPITVLCTSNDFELPYLINFLYFWYSLLYLLGRTSGVFLIAASINDAAKYPVKFVRRRQTTEWCPELERFGDQTSSQVVALSGMKFFFITRSLLFSMAGTILTYELVLLQFDAETKQSGNVTVCDSI